MNTQTIEPKPSTVENNLRSWISTIDPQIVGLLIALIILIALIGSLEPAAFFNPINMLSIGEGVTLVGLTALAAMTIIIMGGLDISIGSIVGLCSAAAGVAMLSAGNGAVGALLGIAASVGIGLAAGLFNGVIVTRGKIDPIVVTLGTFTAYRGVALLITGDGYAVNVQNDIFNLMGTTNILGIPFSIWVWILFAIGFHFYLKHTLQGRNIYAIGANPIASRQAGIPLDRTKLIAYTLSGLIAAIAAILYTARTKSGQPVSGSEELALQAITAAILGGVSLKGGKGNVFGVFLSVMIIGVLQNGMILMSVPTFYQRIARGLLLVIAVFIQNWRLKANK